MWLIWRLRGCEAGTTCKTVGYSVGKVQAILCPAVIFSPIALLFCALEGHFWSVILFLLQCYFVPWKVIFRKCNIFPAQCYFVPVSFVPAARTLLHFWTQTQGFLAPPSIAKFSFYFLRIRSWGTAIGVKAIFDVRFSRFNDIFGARVIRVSEL